MWMWDDSDTATAASYAKQTDVAIVFIQADAGEGIDRYRFLFLSCS